MDFENLGVYTNFTKLFDKLTYLHTSNKTYSIFFDVQQKNWVYMFYDVYKKKYNFYFKLEDEKINTQFQKIEKESAFSEIPNKMKFSELLRKKIDKLISVLQSNWYKLIYSPEVSLFDLENLSNEIEEQMKEYNIWIIEELDSDKDLKKNKVLLNKILLYHWISATNLLNEPKLNDEWRYKIRISSISLDKIDLFPKQDKLLKNINLDVTAVPNIYFPNISIITIIKKFTFKELDFEIVYEWQNFSNSINIIAKEYYDKYKKHPDDRLLNFSLKLIEIVKNPYNSKNLTKTTAENILIQSNCQKCWSNSWLFHVQLSNVKIKTHMWKFETATLFPENILSYKDILSINCLECWNSLIEDKQLINQIIRRRQFLTWENWISFENWKPILDSDWEDLIVHYDIVELEVEFDSTNPMLPTMNYNKIINVWKITWWSDKTLKRTKTFYDR